MPPPYELGKSVATTISATISSSAVTGISSSSVAAISSSTVATITAIFSLGAKHANELVFTAKSALFTSLSSFAFFATFASTVFVLELFNDDGVIAFLTSIASVALAVASVALAVASVALAIACVALAVASMALTIAFGVSSVGAVGADHPVAGSMVTAALLATPAATEGPRTETIEASLVSLERDVDG